MLNIYKRSKKFMFENRLLIFFYNFAKYTEIINRISGIRVQKTDVGRQQTAADNLKHNKK